MKVAVRTVTTLTSQSCKLINGLNLPAPVCDFASGDSERAKVNNKINMSRTA